MKLLDYREDLLKRLRDPKFAAAYLNEVLACERGRASQIFTFPSLLALASRFPSGLKRQDCRLVALTVIE